MDIRIIVKINIFGLNLGHILLALKRTSVFIIDFSVKKSLGRLQTYLSSKKHVFIFFFCMYAYNYLDSNEAFQLNDVFNMILREPRTDAYQKFNDKPSVHQLGCLK